MLFEKIQLEPGEEILQVVRRHWFLLFIEFIGVVLMAGLPFLGLVILAFLPTLGAAAVAAVPALGSLPLIPFLVGGLSVWFLLVVIVAYMIWTHYYLDLWVITDRRIIMIDQVRFFSRRVSSFRLERLQDLSVVMNGIIETFLNFGSLRTQTAATTDDHFRMNGLPDPRGLLSLIQSAADRRLSERPPIA